MKPTPENNPDLAKALRVSADKRERIAAAVARCIRRDMNPSVNKVQEFAATSRQAVTHVLRAWRRDLLPDPSQGWGADLPAVLGLEQAKPPTEDDSDSVRTELAAKIVAATTDGEREQICHELGAHVAAGHIDHQAAREIRGALAEARHSAAKKRELEPPPEDPTKLLLASAEAMQLARLVDLLVDDEIRDEVFAFAAGAMERDLELHPNVDEGGA